MKDWKASSLKGKLKLVIFSLLPVIVLLVIAEIIASSSIYRHWRVVKDPFTGADYYTMQIGRFWGDRSITPLNAMGFPDVEFATVGPKGDCVHVVLSGDSFVFGDGVDASRSFFALVKSWSARQNPGRCIRFFNIAERATTIEQQATRIRQTLPLLQPDLVLLGQYQNDLTDLTKPGFAAYVPSDPKLDGTTWADVIRKRVPLFRLSLIKYLTYHSFAYMVERDIKYDVLAQWSIFEDPAAADQATKLTGIYDSLYTSLVGDLRKEKVGFGVIIFPSKFDLLAGRSPEERYFVSLADRLGVPHLSLYPALDSSRARYPYLMYDGHLNEYGNYIVAKTLAQWLFVSDAAPFVALRGAPAVAAAAPRAAATRSLP